MGRRRLYFGIFSIILTGILVLNFNAPDKNGDFVFLASLSGIFNQNVSAEPFLTSTGVLFSDSPEIIFIEESGIMAAASPLIIVPQTLGAFFGSEEPLPPDDRKTIVEYIVKSGDTLSSIAENFEVSLNTLLWANNLSKNSVLKIGQKLVILPVSGVVHHVKSGDTVSVIAKTYKAEAGKIVAFNELNNENDIYIGDILIVPHGAMPPPPAPLRPQPSSAQTGQNLANAPLKTPLVPPYLITQGLHWYNAVDLSYSGYACGRPVLAAASGTVQKTGYDRVAGNYVRILHPDGVITFYGHLSGIVTGVGQAVGAGQTIGYIGNTGHTVGSTGCHVHFEVRGARNPFIR